MDNSSVSVLNVVLGLIGLIAVFMNVAIGLTYKSFASLLKSLEIRVSNMEREQAACSARVREHAAKHLHELLAPVAEQLKRVQVAVDSLNTVLAERTGSGAENQKNVEFRLVQLENELRDLEKQYAELKTQVAIVQTKQGS